MKINKNFKENIWPIIAMLFWEIVFLFFVFPWIWIPLAVYGENWEGPRWTRYIACRSVGVRIAWKNL